MKRYNQYGFADAGFMTPANPIIKLILVKDCKGGGESEVGTVTVCTENTQNPEETACSVQNLFILCGSMTEQVHADRQIHR